MGIKEIRGLSEVGLADLSVVGGKAANLGNLIKGGFNVPNGFVVLPDLAFREKGKDVLVFFDKLGLSLVAVRSSASCEDSSRFSFAGQFETYTGIPREQLTDTIKKCRKSKTNPRVIKYCEINGINIKNVKVSVVVQKMIRSRISGVAFSVDPVTNNRENIHIEAGFGLGELIVSGRVSPDSYSIRKNDLSVVEKLINYQSEMERVNKDGSSSIVSLNEEEGSKRKISDEDLIKVAKVTQKVEKYYGYPVDIEWAYGGDELYILQARPVTTIPGGRR